MSETVKVISSNLETIRDSYKKEDRITIPVLTKYERARLIGERAEQISRGSPPLVDVGKLTDPVDIAEKELTLKMIPLMIQRTLPNGNVEIWKIEDLIIFDM